jgi:protein tyrosine/serine phosphatase
MRGYFIDGTDIVFIFDESLQGVTSPSSVSLYGAFVAYIDTSGWNLTSSRREGLWYLVKPLASVMLPANSGRPEFKFICDGVWLNALQSLPGGDIWPDGGGGFINVIHYPGDDPAVFAQNYLLATTFRTNYDSDEQMANFREVRSGAISPGVLYRSYNPIFASKPLLPLESARLLAAQRLIETNGILSVVNLSDQPEELSNANPFAYYQTIIDNGNIVYAYISSYDITYYLTDTESFAIPMAEVVRFVGTHNGPYLVHCRLGTDRTGTVTAVLEAFMGSKWSEIEADYVRSTEMGIGEFRSGDLIRYAIGNMLKTEISDNSILSNELRAYLRTTAGLSDAELDALYAKLAGL